MFTPNEGMLKAMYKAARRQRFRDNMADFGNDLNYNLQRNLRGSNSNEDLIKGALSAGATAAFGPVGGLAAGFLGNALFPQEQETVVNPRVERNLNPYGMAQGGMVQQNMVPVEVEGDEMFELPNGQVGEFDGPNHEQGGIPTALPAGTNVYSKRVRGEDGRTMADRKESREKRLKKILEQLKKRPADAPTRNAVSREVERIEQEEQQDMQIMQMYQLRDMLAQARQEQMMQGQMQGQMQQGQMSPEMMQQAMQQQQMQQGQMQGQMPPEMMQGQMPPEMMQGEMPMMEAGGVLFPGLEEGMAYPDTLQEYKLIQSIDDPQQSQMDELNNKKASRLFNKLGNQYGEIAKTYQDKLSPLFEESETANSSSLEMMPELSEMAYGGLIMPMFEAGGTVRGEFLESFNPGDYSDKNKVREVQETLAEAGYDLPNSTTKSGSYDGVWGEETQRAYDNYMAERSNPENLGPTPASDNRVFDPLAVRYEADLPEVTVTAKRMNKLNWDNYLKAAEKYLSLRNNIEGFTPEDLVNPIKEHYEKTGRLFPLELLMVNMQNEGSFNKDGGRSKWTNPVNWGEYDSGTKLKFKHPQEAIAAYIRGMDKSYLQEGKVSVDDLMQNFVNKRGYRYATDTRYEEKGRQTLNKIRNQLKDFDLSEQANIIQPELPESTVVQAEMPRESTAVSMPMMQAGGVIRNGNTMNGFTDLAMLLGGYNKMQNGGIANFDKKTGNVAGLQQFLAEQGYDMSSSRKKDGTYDGVWGKSTEAAYNDYIVTKKRERAEGAKIFDIPKLPVQIEYDNEVNRLKSLSDNESWQQLSDLDRALLESRFQRRIISKEAEERGYRDSNAYFADLVQDFDPQEMQSIFDNYEKYMEKSYASPRTEFPQEPDYLEQRRLDATETAKGLKELGNFFNMQMQSGGVIPNTQNNTGFTDLAMLLGGYNKMAAGGTTSMMSDDYINQFANYQLPVMEAGGEVQGDPPLREVLRKILQFESNHGASDGSGLSNFGNKEIEKDFKNEEEALDWIMENIVPKIPEDLSTLEKLAFADHLYNTGTDPRVWAYQAYLQSIDSDKLKDGEWKDRMKYKEAMDKGKYEGSKLEKQIDKFYEEVMALPAEERMKLLNRGRDFYYRNIVPKGEKAVTDNPFGAKSDAYQNTWFQRIINTSNLEPYSDEVYVPYSEETAQVFNVENLDKPVETTYNPLAEPAQDQTTTEASGPSFFEERLRLNQDLFEGRRNESDYEIPFAPPPVEPSLFQDLLGLNQSFLEGRMSPGYESPYITDTRSTQVSDEQYQRPTDEEIKAAQFTEQDKVLAGLNLNPTKKKEIKKLQTALQAAGYDLGPKGVDGKLSNYTTAAIDSWKTDYANKEAIQKDLYNYQRSTGLGAATDTQISRLAATDTDAGLLNRGALGEDFSVATKSQFGDQMIQAGKTTPTTPEESKEKTEPQWKSDPLSTAGVITSGVSPLVATILNRLGDKENINFYANYGRDAERALDAAERGIAGARDRGFEENRLAQNLRARQARNAARSSNVMQAMQQAALTSGMKANEQLTGQYQNALRTLLGNRAQFEQAQDQAVMRGREAAFTADVKDRDQFYTNLASNLANVGSMFQTLGRQKEVFDVFNDPNRNTDNLAAFLQLGDNAMAPLYSGSRSKRNNSGSSNSGS
jgi:hypothetical protein